jgi:uncharacterized damage-inducible protein DinB
MRTAQVLSTRVTAPEDPSSGLLLDDNVEAIKQGIDLIARLDDRLYTRPVRELSLSGVGAHFRHCLDFYQGFLSGVESGRINYDRRARDERIEKSRLFAIAKLRAITIDLGRVSAIENGRVFETLLEGKSDSDWSASSLKRELQFLLSHTIHHYALIAVALRLQGFEPGDEFGVAPSTLRHWRKTA